MKTKFISLIVSLAVVLGLMLVPAVPAVPAVPIASADGGLTIEIRPQETEVGFNIPFQVEVWINTTDTDWNAMDFYVAYNTTYVNATAYCDSCQCSFEIPLDWNKNNSWNATHGMLHYACLHPGNYFSASQKIATVNFTSRSATGITGLDFIWLPGEEATMVSNGTDILINGTTNWDKAVGGTVKIGSPNLTVDVIPDGKGTVEANETLLIGDPNTTSWTWGATVNLEAIESTDGYEWDHWTGTNDNNANPTTVTMDDAMSVEAYFVEEAPILDVYPNVLPDLMAMKSDTGVEDNDTVTIENDGGGTLWWTVGSPPIWSVGDTWVYNNTYCTYYGVPWPEVVLFNQSGGASSWSPDQAYYGSCSVNMSVPGGGGVTDEAGFALRLGATFQFCNISKFYYWLYDVSGDATPYMLIALTPTEGGNGSTVDRLVIMDTPGATPTDEWAMVNIMDVANCTGHWGTLGDTYVGEGNITAAQAAYGSRYVYSIAPQVGTWTSGVKGTGYVDDIRINDQIYPVEPYGAELSTVTMNVTDDTDNDTYTVDVEFSPPIMRVLDIEGIGIMYAKLFNATALVDKYSLDFIQQDARLSAELSPGTWQAGNATVKWNYEDCTAGTCFYGEGHHGWPYYPGKLWKYTVNTSLSIGENPVIYEPEKVVFAAVKGLTNVTATGTPLDPFKCWEIAHMANRSDPLNSTPAVVLDPPNTTAKVEYWSAYLGNYMVTADGGTFVAPPMDIRAFKGMTGGPYAPAPWSAHEARPSWLSFDPEHGNVGIPDSDTLTVTANSLGLDVGIEMGNFTISAPTGSWEEETVEVTFEITPATSLPSGVMRDLPGNATLPNCTYPGNVIDVYVNFSAPVENFSAIGLTDLAPDGWMVTVKANWSTPDADHVRISGNKVEIAWEGGVGVYGPGDNFTGMYRVTVPETAKPGINVWPDCDNTSAWAEYWFGPKGPYTTCVSEEFELRVTVPGDVWGETRDVNANLLPDVNVTVKRDAAFVTKDESTPNYLNTVWDTGDDYWLRATKDRYDMLDTNNMFTPRNLPHLDYINFSTPDLLYDGYNLDFEGDYGLIPTGCTMSYAMESVNHMLFVPIEWIDDENFEERPSWQLTSHKVAQVIANWQYPD